MCVRAEAEKRADARLAKMTLDDKLTLVGGINDFYTQAIPRLDMPQFRKSDGAGLRPDHGLSRSACASDPNGNLLAGEYVRISHPAHAPSFRWR